jgi:hypothetical protein
MRSLTRFSKWIDNEKEVLTLHLEERPCGKFGHKRFLVICYSLQNDVSAPGIHDSGIQGQCLLFKLCSQGQKCYTSAKERTSLTLRLLRPGGDVCREVRGSRKGFD